MSAIGSRDVWDAASYVRISQVDAVTHQDLAHVAHCLIHCSEETPHPTDPAVTHGSWFGLMQVRSDGLIGFPGGGVDGSESGSVAGILGGLHRELVEEMAFPFPRLSVPPDNHVSCHIMPNGKRVTHFYHLPLERKEIEAIEACHTSARDFPSESVGMLRLPIHWIQRQDGSRDFSQDPHNQLFWSHLLNRYPFCGNSREQLIETMQLLGVVDRAHLDSWIQ